MSIAAQTASALVRALCIGFAAVAISGWLAPALAGMRARMRMISWALLLAPFLTPSLLISYTYSKFALALMGSPWGLGALYAMALLLKLVPVAVVVRTLLPSPLTAAARHCHRVMVSSFFFESVVFRCRGAGPAPWFAGGIVSLLAFADFELASLWSVKSWTVALFDAHTGGLEWRESLRLAAWPLGIQLGVLALLIPRKRRMRSGKIDSAKSARAVFAYLAVVAFIATMLPVLLIFSQAVSGFRAILENFVLTWEIIASVLFGFCAAAISLRMARSSTLGSLRLLAVPGLLGSLTVALLVLALFQTPLLRRAYDTPLPLLVALIILLLPIALVLGAALRTVQASPMRHIARQLRSRRLAWALEWQPRIAAFALLFCCAYFDLTASAILAPTRFMPVFVRLHNLAHYGQTPILSAMMLAAFAVPVGLLLLTAAAGQIHARRDGR